MKKIITKRKTIAFLSFLKTINKATYGSVFLFQNELMNNILTIYDYCNCAI